MWEADQHKMLVKEAQRSCGQYITAIQRDDYKEQKAQAYTSLVMWEKLWSTVGWMTELEKGGGFTNSATNAPKRGANAWGVSR